MRSVLWRVVLTDCPKSPAGEVLYTGDGTVHDGVSAAFQSRRDLGPEVGIAVEWLYTLHGTMWMRYCYLMTGQQREMTIEMDRRRRIEGHRIAKFKTDEQFRLAKEKRRRGRAK